MTAPACSGIAKVAGGTATQQIFSCTPTATGAIQVTVAASSGGSQATINPSVPQPQVTMNILLGTTALGTIIVELNPTATPITVNNFLQYVNGGSYNNAIFHRIAGFVIQGGGYNQSLTAIPTKAPIALEVNKGLSNTRGTIAMARNNVLDSATSQFFINMQNNITLDTYLGGYAVFGKVVSGMTVADQINAVPTIANLAPFDTLPAPKAVVISSASQTQ